MGNIASTLSILGLLAACAPAPRPRVYEPEQGYATVDAEGVSIAYFAAGDPNDPLIVLLHGFPDTPHAWDQLRPQLAEPGYYVVSPFLRGYAPGYIPATDEYDVESLGRDVLALIVALGKQDADVVGHDWGAMAAYAAAALEPARVRHLVTMVIPHPATLKVRLRDLRRVRHFLALRKPGAAKRFARRDFAGVDELYARWSPTWKSSAADREAVKNTFAAPGSLVGALGYYRDISVKAPAFLRAPTEVSSLVIAGIDDGTTPLDSFDDLTAFAGDVRVEKLPTGHFPHRERPDLVLPLLREFLGPPVRPDSRSPKSATLAATPTASRPPHR